MKYTAIDLTHRKITRSFRGYRVAEVDELLSQIAGQLEEYALDTVRMQNQLEQMREEISRFKEMEQTLNNAILLAQRSADEVRANARAEADQVLEQARRDAAMLAQNAEHASAESLNEMRRLAQRRDAFVDTLRSAARDLGEWVEHRRWEQIITLQPNQKAGSAAPEVLVGPVPVEEDDVKEALA